MLHGTFWTLKFFARLDLNFPISLFLTIAVFIGIIGYYFKYFATIKDIFTIWQIRFFIRFINFIPMSLATDKSGGLLIILRKVRVMAVISSVLLKSWWQKKAHRNDRLRFCSLILSRFYLSHTSPSRHRLSPLMTR